MSGIQRSPSLSRGPHIVASDNMPGVHGVERAVKPPLKLQWTSSLSRGPHIVASDNMPGVHDVERAVKPPLKLQWTSSLSLDAGP